MYTAATVHTTGVNWQSLGVIVAALAIAVSVILWTLARRDARQARALELRQRAEDARQQAAEDRNEAIKEEIATAVDRLGERLEAKLETKEAVARISERLARVEGSRGIAVVGGGG